MPTFKSLPFDLETRLAGVSGKGGAASEGLGRLAAAVADRSRPELRTLALSKLAETDLPYKERLLASILADRSEPPEIRHVAALCLGRLGGRAALAALERQAGSVDALVQNGALKSLVALGEEGSREALSKVAGDPSGPNGPLAAFALLVIAHRLNLKDRASAWPRLDPEKGDGGRHCASPVRILPAEPGEVELCLRSLGPRPFGIELDPASASSLYCGRNEWMLAFNQELAGPARFRALAGRKWVLAVIAQKNRHLGRYWGRFVILAAPAGPGEASLGIFGATGNPLSLGTLVRREHYWNYRLQPVAGPKAYSLFGKGIIGEGFALSGELSAGRGEKRPVRPLAPHPLPEPRRTEAPQTVNS